MPVWGGHLALLRLSSLPELAAPQWPKKRQPGVHRFRDYRGFLMQMSVGSSTSWEPPSELHYTPFPAKPSASHRGPANAHEDLPSQESVDPVTLDPVLKALQRLKRARGSKGGVMIWSDLAWFGGTVRSSY